MRVGTGPVLAWHWLHDDRTMHCAQVHTDTHTRAHLDPVEVGWTYWVKGQIKLCEWGLHASGDVLDAFQYAPGLVLCRVEMGGRIRKCHDKLVAETRTVLWMADMTAPVEDWLKAVRPRPYWSTGTLQRAKYAIQRRSDPGHAQCCSSFREMVRKAGVKAERQAKKEWTW